MRGNKNLDIVIGVIHVMDHNPIFILFKPDARRSGHIPRSIGIEIQIEHERSFDLVHVICYRPVLRIEFREHARHAVRSVRISGIQLERIVIVGDLPDRFSCVLTAESHDHLVLLSGNLFSDIYDIDVPIQYLGFRFRVDGIEHIQLHVIRVPGVRAEDQMHVHGETVEPLLREIQQTPDVAVQHPVLQDRNPLGSDDTGLDQHDLAAVKLVESLITGEIHIVELLGQADLVPVPFLAFPDLEIILEGDLVHGDGPVGIDSHILPAETDIAVLIRHRDQRPVLPLEHVLGSDAPGDALAVLLRDLDVDAVIQAEVRKQNSRIRTDASYPDLPALLERGKRFRDGTLDGFILPLRRILDILITRHREETENQNQTKEKQAGSFHHLSPVGGRECSEPMCLQDIWYHY